MPGKDEEHPVRLVEQSWQKNDPDPKALACYGVLWQEGPADEPVRRKHCRCALSPDDR